MVLRPQITITMMHILSNGQASNTTEEKTAVQKFMNHRDLLENRLRLNRLMNELAPRSVIGSTVYERQKQRCESCE